MQTLTAADKTNPEGIGVSIDDGIATLLLDLPGSKVNKLTRAVMTELEARIVGLGKDPGVRALVIASGKPDGFVAGADIDEIESLTSPDAAAEAARFGQRVFAAIESL